MERSKISFRAFFLFAALAIVMPHYAYAQCDSSSSLSQYYADSAVGKDGIKYKRHMWFPLAGKGFDMNDIMPYYLFSMPYPGMNKEVRFTFAEFRQNNRKLDWVNWCKNREIKDWSSQELSRQSRTTSFVVNAGDTITFFREFTWRDLISQKFIGNDYTAADNLSWAIELRDSLFDKRLLMIDTLYVEKRFLSGKPIIHSSLPRVARLQCIIPPHITSKKAFIRINVYAEGEGKHYFIRTDRIVAGMISEPKLRRFEKEENDINITNENFPTDLKNKFSTPVSPNPNNGGFDIDLPSLSTYKDIVIRITNSKGDLVFQWFFDRLEKPRRIPVFIENNGIYWLGVYAESKFLSAEKIIVSK